MYENPRDFMFKNVESDLQEPFQQKVQEDCHLSELDFILGSTAVGVLLRIVEQVRSEASPFGFTSGNLF